MGSEILAPLTPALFEGGKFGPGRETSTPPKVERVEIHRTDGNDDRSPNCPRSAEQCKDFVRGIKPPQKEPEHTRA